MDTKNLPPRLQMEIEKHKGDCTVSFIDKEKYWHIEIRLYKDGNPLHKGYYVLRKKGNPQIYTGHLFQHVEKQIMLKVISELDKKQPQTIKNKPDDVIKWGLINLEKTVYFHLFQKVKWFAHKSSQPVDDKGTDFSLQLVKTDVNKAIVAIDKVVKKEFLCDIQDFKYYNDLLGACCEYIGSL